MNLDIDQPEGVYVCRLAFNSDDRHVECKHGGKWEHHRGGNFWITESECPVENKLQHQEFLENLPEWEEGAHAQAAGMNLDANPYFKIAGGGANAFKAWDLGWKQTRGDNGI